MAAHTRKEESFVIELVELANHALNEKDYEFPFVALVVGADCSVTAFEFVKEASVPNILYEKITQMGHKYLFPITFFFYCRGKEPFSAKINAPEEEAICRVP